MSTARMERAVGYLVAIEGIDGVGKTTQARRLVEWLRTGNRSVHLTRQPSDGPIGRQIREMIVSRDAGLDRETLALLFAADRVDHLRREVMPQLARGAVIVSDRWYHSSLAYQAESWEDLAWVSELNARVRRPDLTLFLRARPRVAAARRSAEGRAPELFDTLGGQRRVAAMYERAIMLVTARGEHVHAFDGELAVDQLHAQIADLVGSCLASEWDSP